MKYKKTFGLVGVLMLAVMVAAFTLPISWAGMQDRFSKVELEKDPYNRINIPEVTAPSGNPLSNHGWIYVKDSGGTSNLYFEADDGTVTDIVAAGTVKYDDIANPDGAGAIDFAAHVNVWDVGTTAADGFEIDATGAFGDISVMKIEQKTGNPTNGTMFEIEMADTDPDFMSLSQGGTEKVNISDDGSIVLSAGSITLSHATGGDLTIGDDLSVGGDMSVTGTWTTNSVTAATATQKLTLDGNGIGGVDVGVTSTGDITLGDTAVVSDGYNVTIGEGSLVVDNDATDEVAITITTDATTSGGAINIVSKATTTNGKVISATADDLTTGDLLYLDTTASGLTTGNYIHCYDGAASDFEVGLYGATTIAGNASTDVLTVTAGDIQITAGDIDLDNGQLMVNTTQDLSNNISRNFAGAGTAAVLVVNDDNASSTNIALDINQDGTAASTAVRVVHDGDSPAIDLSAGAARTGNVIAIAMANQLAEKAINITGAITCATDEGVIDVHSTGVIAGALVRLDGDTAAPAAIDGYILEIDDDTLAQAGKYAVEINSETNEALYVSKGLSKFTEITTHTAGIDADGDLDVDFSDNSEEANITASATDYAANSAILAVVGSAGAGQTNASYLLQLDRNANGDAQDNFLRCRDNAYADTMFSVDSGGAMHAAGGGSLGSATDSFLHTDTVELTNVNIKALRGTKKELIAAPGASNYIEVVSVNLILDYGANVLTESVDNLVVQYATSGDDITASIEMTGFIDQAADTIMVVNPSNPLAANAASDMLNNAVELFNTGDGEFGGNAGADTTMTVKITYRIHAAGL